MNFFKYIGIDQETFVEKYLHGGWVTEGIHKTLPLNIFTYSRKCQQEDNWDSVISKCRGIVVDRRTDEIVARPFEKFHNYGSPQAEGTLFDARVQPTVWEKMDGFMVTAFKYEGVWRKGWIWDGARAYDPHPAPPLPDPPRPPSAPPVPGMTVV